MSFVTDLLQRAGILRQEGEGEEVEPAVAAEVEPEAPPDGVAEVEELPDHALAEVPDAAEEDDLEELPDDALSELPPGPLVQRISLAELITARRSEAAEQRKQELADRTGLQATFDQIFEAAEVPELPGGWTVDLLGEVIAAAKAEGMGPVQRRIRLYESLVRDGLKPKDIVVDAVARDEALDTYEGIVASSVEVVRTELAQEAEELAEQILSLRERIVAVGQRREQLVHELEEWRSRKSALERQWEEVLVELISDPGQRPDLVGNQP